LRTLRFRVVGAQFEVAVRVPATAVEAHDDRPGPQAILADHVGRRSARRPFPRVAVGQCALTLIGQLGFEH